MGGQIASRQIAGVEAAIHAVRCCFDEESIGLLLVDASNAFNSLNCNLALLSSGTVVLL